MQSCGHDVKLGSGDELLPASADFEGISGWGETEISFSGIDLQSTISCL